jgi:hypothetical protein
VGTRAPITTGRGSCHGIGPQGGHGTAHRRAIRAGASRSHGGASGRNGGTPPALTEEEAGILQFVVSSASPARLRFRGAVAHTFASFVDRVTPTVSSLTPFKALKVRTSMTTGRRSERVQQTAASVAAVGERSRVTTAVARPQQEEAAVAASLALVPHAPPQGCGQARSGSRPTRDRGVAGDPADGDYAPDRGQSRGQSGQPPSARPRCW